MRVTARIDDAAFCIIPMIESPLHHVHSSPPLTTDVAQHAVTGEKQIEINDVIVEQRGTNSRKGDGRETTQKKCHRHKKYATCKERRSNHQCFRGNHPLHSCSPPTQPRRVITICLRQVR
jgi:hypothetical protein